MNKASKIMIGAFLAATAAFGAQTITPSMLGCEDAKAIVSAGGKLELGKWYTDWSTCKKYAEDNKVPVLFIWSNHGCVHCYWTDRCFLEESFKTWAANNDAGKVIYCFMAGGESGYPDGKGSAAYNWMWKTPSSIDAFPFVTLYWPDHGKNGIVLHKTGDQFNSNSSGKKPENFWSDKSMTERVSNVIYWMETSFAGWKPEPQFTYDGGRFTETNYPYASLQAEKTTGSVFVKIVRDSLRAASQTMKIFVDGSDAVPATETVVWAENQKEQSYEIANFGKKWYAEDRDVVAQLLDAEGKVASEVRIACVEVANSAVNPKWIGESFDFGEWTMDFDAAKALAKKTSGAAYTLVCSQGSQWCPDCGNVEKNFLGVNGGKDFTDWAKAHNVALVTVDIPNYKQADPTGATSPCLLKREALAGAPDGQLALRSGLGYLTRKGVSDEDAAAALARNHDLVTKNTAEGGLHRPEDTNSYRTGVPIFVLLRKDGSVAARLTYMAAKSPTNDVAFANILKRFDEMLWIADNNATEIENNYASAGSVPFKANGGSETASLSHTDLCDTFHLDGVGGNALQLVTVTGESSAEVKVSLVKLGADGKEQSLASKVAKLSDGISLEYAFSEAGDYYAKVEATSVTAPEFALENATANNFHSYTIVGETVLEPQQDRATAKPAEGSDKVAMTLTEGTLYRISGLASCAALEAVTDKPGFYVSTTNGIVEVTLEKIDGEITYQIWESGSVGFVTTEASVQRSVCDESGEPLEIAISRVGGKSGAVRARVSIDWEKTTAHLAHVWLTNDVEFVWNDGDTAAKSVKLYLDDDPEWPSGEDLVVLTLEVVASEAGDVTVAEGKGTYALTVIDEGVLPGTAFFTGTDPVAVDGKVYVRASEGVQIGIVRVGGDKQVSGLLTSTVPGTTFATEDPRDLTGSTFWWAASESDERGGAKTFTAKVPAGKEAIVKFVPQGDLRGLVASNAVTVVSLADDAPGFATVKNEFALTRYVESRHTVATTGHQAGSEISFKILSGKLPSGLKLSADDTGALAITGVPTAKAGVFDLVCQAHEKRNGKTVDGLLCAIRLALVDVTTKGADGTPALNPAVAKSRSFKTIPVYDETRKCLAGTVDVTIPTKGKVSAKFTGFAGKFSFSSKSWSDAQPGGALNAALTGKNKSVTMELQANPDGSVGIVFNGGDIDGFEGWTDGQAWSKTNTANDWAGYYTVALKRKAVVSESSTGLAPAGYGYLTLQMNASNAKKGQFKVAGKLANGTKVSGSYVLAKGLEEMPDGVESEAGVAWLPIVKVSSKDAYSLLVGLAAKAYGDKENRRCVESPAWCDGAWTHTEKKGSWDVSLTAHGSWYDLTVDSLGGCCSEYYMTNSPFVYVNSLKVGGVTIDDDTITVNQADRKAVSLSLKASTGIVTGKISAMGSKVDYFGIIVNGWGEGCGCEAVPDGTTFLPFMCGSYLDKSRSVVSGGEVSINK